ncbi:MAG TPA: class I SAM-dependent methyltransferase [Gaiellaceae bacterium]|nr:class I SAM-dependent methyltransferase [Gaiellaceae bacterium]
MSRSSRPTWAEDAERNRTAWNGITDSYHEQNASFIAAGLAWGLWQLPESELQILGEVAGKDILELGCGEAEWSRALARLGARPVGLDISPTRLELARAALRIQGIELPLIEAPAEQVPLPDSSFDIVFCDWGATNFADPYAVVPEVARLLRSGGRFAFSGTTPISWAAFDDAADTWGLTLQRDWFGMLRHEEADGMVEFALPHGEWIALFRANGLTIERLVEIRPPEGARSSYRDEEQTAWARRFPMEQIWVVQKP